MANKFFLPKSLKIRAEPFHGKGFCFAKINFAVHAIYSQVHEPFMLLNLESF